MKVFIDSVGIRGSGAATVLWNILKNIPSELSEIHFKVFVLSLKQRSFTILPNNLGIQYEEVSFDTFNLLNLLLWQQVWLPRLCRKEKPDIILCMGNVGAMNPSIPQVIYFHQSIYFSKEYKIERLFNRKLLFYKLKKFLTIKGMKAAKFVITQTEAVRKSIVESHKITANKIVAIHTGVPEPLPSSGHPNLGKDEIKDTNILDDLVRPLLIYISHPATYKNFEVLINGMSLLAKKNFLGTLILTLSKPEKYPKEFGLLVEKYQRMVIDLGIQNNVKFIGAIRPDSVKKFIENADIFVFPSLIESFPQSLAEAMACGAVMLLADKPYAREIASNAAIYFDPYSPSSFANAVTKICSDGNLRKELSMLSFERSKLFSYESCTKKIISLLISCVGEKQQKS